MLLSSLRKKTGIKMPAQSLITGTGSYLPEKIVTNTDLSKTMDTTDEWIRQRTGIEQRHVAAEGELTSDIATHAGRLAIESAGGLKPSDLDAIVVATTTPDDTFPATAATVQANLGASSAFAFDVQAVCAGFIYALDVSDALIKSGKAEKILVVGAETFTRILDWEDRSTAVLFGDGAGAVVLEASEDQDYGILSTALFTDGRFRDLLYVDGGVSKTGDVGHVRMKGNEVFRHAVAKLSESLNTALERASLSAEDIDWLVPHQANIRIIDNVQKKLGMDSSKVIRTVSHHANTSAASIPLALDSAVSSGQIKPGHVIAFEAIGGGLTWGAALARFGRP
jgi:3-oxoacyl-[acyl-carrier-protein] synthase-3